MVWYPHVFQNFPQFIVIHTVKDFGIVNKAEIGVFLEVFAFSMIQRMLAIWSLVPLPFLKPVWTSGSSWFTYCWSLAWRIFFLFYFLTLQYCVGFAIYQHESATGIHVFPILNPLPSSFPVPSLWVVPLHQPQASSIVHRTWTGDSFHTCLNSHMLLELYVA